MGDRVRVCGKDDLSSGEVTSVPVPGGIRVAVVRVGDDFYALSDRCSHENVALSEGEVYEDELEIECWKHGSAFNLVTGAPNTLPATKPVPVFEVEVEGDDVYVVTP